MLLFLFFCLSGGTHAKEKLTKAIPIQRIGNRVDIGDTVLFVVSDAAQLLTGTTIIADGGNWLTNSNNYQQRKQLLRKYSKL